MSVNVLSEILINRSRDAVAAFASDPDNAPKWYVNIKTVEWKTPRPLQVGSKVQFVAKFLGRDLRYTYEFIELVPGSRVVMRTEEGPFPMETTYEWESPGPDKTLMRLRNRGNPSGFGSLASPFLSRAMKSANAKDLELLKRILEAGELS